jgi:hypothetical protein
MSGSAVSGRSRRYWVSKSVPSARRPAPSRSAVRRSVRGTQAEARGGGVGVAQEHGGEDEVLGAEADGVADGQGEAVHERPLHHEAGTGAVAGEGLREG